jgi:acetyltransferase-like isoleucine patch superfamily enzyme
MREITVMVNGDLLEEFSRRRIFFAGKAGAGLNIGDALSFYPSTEIEPYTSFNGGGRILCSMGAFSYSQSRLFPGLTIERYCSIAHGFDVIGKRHPVEALSTSNFTYTKKPNNLRAALEDHGVAAIQTIRPQDKPMPIINHDVWIGSHVTLARGIVIGTGSVIAAHSVVTKDVPPYAIVGGNPAKIIRYRFPEAVIERLLKSEWWGCAFTSFKDLDISNPTKFLDEFEQLNLKRYAPEKLTADMIMKITEGK